MDGDEVIVVPVDTDAVLVLGDVVADVDGAVDAVVVTVEGLTVVLAVPVEDETAFVLDAIVDPVEVDAVVTLEGIIVVVCTVDEIWLSTVAEKRDVMIIQNLSNLQ